VASATASSFCGVKMRRVEPENRGVGARGIARMLAPLRRAKRSAESWNVRGVEFTNGDVPGVRLRSRMNHGDSK